jgi:lysozyme
MKFSNYNFIKRWEGLELQSYKDGGGVWTIGYGHTRGVKPNQTITLDQAKALLDDDLKDAENAVNTYVKVPLNQNQYDALVSEVFNIGSGNFRGSTFLKRLNAGDYKGAAEAMTWWNKDQNKNGVLVVVQGLVNRREAEKNLFLSPVENPSKNELVRLLMEEYTQKLMEIINA